MQCHDFAEDWSPSRQPADWRVHPKSRFVSDAEEWHAEQAEAPSLDAVVEASAELLNGSDEEEEAPACRPVARDRAVSFLRAHADQARRFGFDFPLPTISVGPNGSVDLHWTLGGFQLLVNFPVDAAERATFYGDNEGSDSIRGSIGTDGDSRSLLPWLVQTK